MTQRAGLRFRPLFQPAVPASPWVSSWPSLSPLVLIGLAAGVSTGRQTERFDRDRDSAQVARLRQVVTDYYARRQGWEHQETTLQENVERAASVSGSHIVGLRRQWDRNR